MPSRGSTAEPAPQVVGVREAQRLQTRARVFDAAVAEFGRSGLAGADVAAIAATAGVARGTFYFHFPTKEHVLVELERAEEAKIVATLDTRSAAPSSTGSSVRSCARDAPAALIRKAAKQASEIKKRFLPNIASMACGSTPHRC